MSKIKISVIGCGYWGKNLVRNFAELGALYAICDAKQELAKKTAETYQVLQHNLEQILSGDCDGVVIAAPAKQHFELAYKALKAGKHVFVEKPMALDLNEARKLVDLSLEVDRKLMVGHLLQYHPAFINLKKLINKGDLGRLQYIYSNRLNLGKFRSEENILWSFAPHDISMILGLVGDMPESVYATGACHLNPKVHDITTTHMNFKNGVHANIFVSWLHPYKEQKLVVVGDQGMAVFDDSLDWNEKLRLYPHKINWVEKLPEPKKADVQQIILEKAEPLKIECQHFIESILHDKKPFTDANEGLRVLQVLTAAQDSLCSNSIIKLKEEGSLYFVHDSAAVDNSAIIGNGTKIWHFSHIMGGAKIGENCIIGQNVMIASGVEVGNRCKIQNNVSLYKGVTLEDGVFCGPSSVFTNVHNPRAEVERKDEFRKTYVERGVTIGANATIICGNRLGAYSLIGAGAVVTKDVKPHAVMVGNPAKQIGWVSHLGEKLPGSLICPREGRSYRVVNDNLVEVEPEVSLG